MASVGIGADLEGVHAVQAALDAGRVELLTIESSRLETLKSMVAGARDAGVTVEVVDRVEAVTAAPQGVTARARPIRTVGIDELVEPAPAAIVLLDHLHDPHNVGAIARSAVAAGMTGLIIPDRRTAPLGPTSFKAAAGAFEHLRVCVHSSSADAVARLARAGLWAVGLTAQGETPLFGLDLLTEPIVIIIGAEGRGVGRLVGERCDVLARIPMAAGFESLNASAAATLAMFEVARVRRADS